MGKTSKDVLESVDGKPAAKQRRSKKAKSSGPKRGLSAFMYFSNFHRPTVMAENSEAKFGDIGKIIGGLWRDATDEEKFDFVEMARKDKERYDSEKAALPQKPKRGLSAFMIFSNARRAQVRSEHPELAFADVGRTLGAMWRELSEEEKVEFKELADVEKEKYQNEVAAFKEEQHLVVAQPPTTSMPIHLIDEGDEVQVDAPALSSNGVPSDDEIEDVVGELSDECEDDDDEM